MAEDISLASLQALHDEIHTRLKAENADYRTLLVLAEAMRRVEASETGTPIEDEVGAEPSAIDLAIRVTQAGAAKRILETKGEPAPVEELLQLIPAFGGRKTSRASLSSSLSQAPEFVSVRHNDRWCWWLVNEPRSRTPQAQDRPAPRSLRWRIGRRKCKG